MKLLYKEFALAAHPSLFIFTFLGCLVYRYIAGKKTGNRQSEMYVDYCRPIRSANYLSPFRCSKEYFVHTE